MTTPFEVRDLRKKDKFVVDDVYIDCYARLVGPTVTVVYAWLCRYANKEQTSWPSLKKLAENVGVNEKTIRRSLKKLAEYNIINIERKGKTMTNRYHLIDSSEWTQECPITNEEVSGHQCPINVDTNVQSGGSEMSNHSKETHSKETQRKDIVVGSETEPPTPCQEWDNESYIQSLVEKEQRHIHIIGLFWLKKGFNFPDRKAAQTRLLRDLKDARTLAPYPDEDIVGLMDYLNREESKSRLDYEWGLSTVVKKIDNYRAGK